ncbi:MAG TPA: hypothetical protein VKM55_04510 [Candidatus Lokiarchaeia archaeon]|nr:hypothetical protein [Candidatus Lokiarchaeia archaeon]
MQGHARLDRRGTIALMVGAIVFIANAGITTFIVMRDVIPGDARDIIGVTHVDGKYNVGNTSIDFLDRGADEILALGSRVIKLWFKDPASAYSYNSTWPASFSSLVDMANYSYYRSVFSKPFTTYILETFSLGFPDGYFLKNFTTANATEEQRQFYELAKYFLQAYQGTGKTFVLQDWETDWTLRGSSNASVIPTPAAINGTIGWLKARQAGVDQARKEVGQHSVRVFNAIEVNFIEPALNGNPYCAVDLVLPHVPVDLVSYSSWDTEANPTDFARALDYIAAREVNDQQFGPKNLYIGEFGSPENRVTHADLMLTVQNVIRTALAWGCPYIVYWELYCNEIDHAPVHSNTDVAGYWLIKVDGMRSWAWNYLHGLFTGASIASGG